MCSTSQDVQGVEDFCVRYEGDKTKKKLSYVMR